MSPTYTLRVAINGSETDVDVENDSADWLTKVAKVRTVDGGGSFIRPPGQAGASLWLNIPINTAHAVRTVTIAVEGPYDGAIPAWATDNGDGTCYRIVFHGFVSQIRAIELGTPLVKVDAFSEMQLLFERRARTAKANNTGPRDLTDAIETAHTLTMGGGNPMVPQKTDFYTLDRPAQEDAPNGTWLKTAMVGTGAWITAEWDGPIDTPAMRWRVDYPWGSTGTRHQIIPAGRPWTYVYEDIGLSWKDFLSRLEVTGTNSAGDRYYGWARNNDATIRAQLGYQTASLASWIDTAAECENAAKWCYRHMGSPTFLRMFTLGVPIDICHADADADADYNPTVNDTFFDHAAVMLGDQFSTRSIGNNNFDNSATVGDNQYGDWPAVCPVGSQRYDEMQALWEVEPDGGGTVDYYTVRSIAREYDPVGGWFVTVGLEPDDVDLASFTSGNATDFTSPTNQERIERMEAQWVRDHPGWANSGKWWLGDVWSGRLFGWVGTHGKIHFSHPTRDK